MQLIWFLSSCLQKKDRGSIAGTAQAESDQWLLMLPATRPDPKLPCGCPCQDSQVPEVGGPAEGFPGDGLDEILTQVPAEERGRKENEQCLQSMMPHGIRASTGQGMPQHSVIPWGLWGTLICLQVLGCPLPC